MIVRALAALAATTMLGSPANQPPNSALATALATSMCGSGEGTGAAGASAAVLVPGLTPAHIAVSSIGESQAFFDQGLGQLFGFDYDEALKSFRKASALDPDCAMCGWGEALALGPYINSGPIDAATIAKARLLTLKALRSPALSDRDRALVEAVHARHAPGGKQSGVHGDRYADTMIRHAARWPDDDLVAVLAAEAIMDAQPWDYWQAGGRAAKGRAGEALALVQRVIARSPDNPQAIHLLIHLTEASANPQLAADPASRLGRIAPAAPHMVHMPSHTWYRIGRFDDAISANKSAIAADEAYARAVGADPKFYGYFNHHSHFLASAATQNGDRATALAAADALDAAITPEAALAKPYLQSRLVTALHARARFLMPAEVLALPSPDRRLPRLLLAWHGVRAEAFAMSGDTGSARAELLALRAARRDAAGSDKTANAVAAIADSVARGRIAEAEGNLADALRQYRAAEAIEANLGYFEPPLWPTPVAVLSGSVRAKQGDRAGAAADFRRALAQRPSNALASAGLTATARG
ncbi:MAG: tetratricopeptide repeat protein [Polymorphobacter sp.]